MVRSFVWHLFVCGMATTTKKNEQERASKTKQANTTDKKVYTVL